MVPKCEEMSGLEIGDGGGGSAAVSIAGFAAKTMLGDTHSALTSSSGSGGGGSPREVVHLVGPATITGGGIAHKKHRRLRKQQHRKQNHGNYGNHGKRIRRNTQPAPNNTNEFLMQEHDHLFHLDLENEDWDANNGDFGQNIPHSTNIHNNLALYSSSDDDQDYLSREFSATYDNVNAERLSSMTKAELISEYQMLQERVETLERKLKSTLASKNDDQNIPSIDGFSTDDKVKVVRDEILRLRDENQKIKSDNKYLRKLMYRGPLLISSLTAEAEADVEMDADRVSTDSGGGSGSIG